MLRRRHGCLYKAPAKEERRVRKAKRSKRDQIKFIDLRFERWQVVGLSQSCWGKAMVAYTKPQQRKKEESERLRGERETSAPYKPAFAEGSTSLNYLKAK